MPASPPPWPTARLHVVTGKGGTGKTTVAAALALALASGGRRTLLVEVEGRQGIAEVFDSPPLPYEERRIAGAAGGGEVRVLAVDAEEALLEYLEMFYNLRRAGSALRRLGAIDFATTIAPGLRDVLLTGKVKEATTRTERGRRVYDAVVLDAPPTGRIARFLTVTGEVAGLARGGPIKTQSDRVIALLRSEQTAVHLVTLLEEMPVQETIDAAAELSAAGLQVGAVIINMVREPLLPAGKPDRDLVAAGLRRVKVPADPATLDALLRESADHLDRLRLERRERKQLARIGRPIMELPFATDGMDLTALHGMAAELRSQGVAAP
ncbi:MAG: ATPase [Actinomycetota bacterium]|nr:ATPase [Actinomycetota bacterium]